MKERVQAVAEIGYAVSGLVYPVPTRPGLRSPTMIPSGSHFYRLQNGRYIPKFARECKKAGGYLRSATKGCKWANHTQVYPALRWKTNHPLALES
jgi:hypothetical protein